jgi:uncharacterized protein (DUF433 family)
VNVQWQEFIEERQDLMGGKPTLKGTRLTVDFVLRQMGAGLSRDELLHQYPTLKPEHLPAVFLYAADLVK